MSRECNHHNDDSWCHELVFDDVKIDGGKPNGRDGEEESYDDKSGSDKQNDHDVESRCDS